MIVALIDNGSIEAASHRNLRSVAAAMTHRIGVPVHAVSWKHSDAIPAAALDGIPGITLPTWLQIQLARGEHDFVFAPFFISPQGAIGSALRHDLDNLQRTAGHFNFTFSDGLAARGAITAILVARIRELTADLGLTAPSVIVVDHGGPSPISAALRNKLTADIRSELGQAVGPVAAAAMEGGEYPHNQPLLSTQLATPGFNAGDVVIAPLFLSPGRHAGPKGDLAQIADTACRSRIHPARPLRCHFTGLVGTHPLAVETLGVAVHEILPRVRSG